MGQQNSYEAGLNCELTLVQQLPIGKIYQQSSTSTMYFIKEYAYTSEEAFQQAFLKFSAKLTSKNDNVLNLQKTNTKVDNTFCSTFYKIVLIFEFINYSLADQIVIRNKENRVFEEKEIWSILFHCTLGISHLKRTQGVEHSAISLKDIKLSEDGTIKIIPTEMLGIYSEHDQNEGTTKKLAMTILSCILMKQVSNQSSEYLQALIDKTKSSKELKKVLYFMVMDDTTFKELEEYLFKLANDQNDTVLSGVSTPVYSTNKKAIQQSNIKVQSLPSQPNETSTLSQKILQPLKQEKEDQTHTLPQFETFETQNPDETDEDKNAEVSCTQEEPQIASLSHQHDTHTFSNQNNLTSMDYKLKECSVMSHQQDNVTVRMPSRKNSDFVSFANNSLPVAEKQHKAAGLYTDPKLLDLIKKDLEEIQYKSRISFGGLNNQQSLVKEGMKASNEIDHQAERKQNDKVSQKFNQNSVYNISASNFNMRPIGSNVENQSSQISITEINKSKSQLQNPEGQKSNDFSKKAAQKIDETFREIENLPKRTKEQQCFGNILDDQASFKKAKSKKPVTTTVRESQVKRDLQKENCFESSQTKRVVQSYQKNQSTSETQVGVSQSNTKQPTQPAITSSQKLSPQLLSSQTSIQPHQQPSLMQFVNQTYQKGEYKGYKLNCLRHGHGTFFYKQGGKYVGDWKQNKMNGKGTLFYPNDDIAYEGHWKDDQLHGFGTLYNEEVMQLEKSFDYQDWTLVEDFWVKYEGEFAMDNKQGKGKLFLSNGEVFEGHFKEDMVEGEGVLTRGNGSRVRGIWRKNKLLRMY